MAIALAVVVFVGTLVIAVWVTHVLRTPTTLLPQKLRERRRALAQRLERVTDTLPTTPVAEDHLPRTPETAEIEARLLAGAPRAALAAAERGLADSGGTAPGPHLLLARALLACGELDAAGRETSRARDLGADGALVDHLEGRLGHLLAVRRTENQQSDAPPSPYPSLVTPFEVFVLSLERKRRAAGDGAIWLTSADGDNQTLSPAEVEEVVTTHFTAYLETLEKHLAAAEAAPGFAEALYHAGRLAVKVGLVDRGRRLLERLEPLMLGSWEREAFTRDLAELRDQDAPPAPPATPPTAQRSTKLRILR